MGIRETIARWPAVPVSERPRTPKWVYAGLNLSGAAGALVTAEPLTVPKGARWLVRWLAKGGSVAGTYHRVYTLSTNYDYPVNLVAPDTITKGIQAEFWLIEGDKIGLSSTANGADTNVTCAALIEEERLE